MKCKLTTLSLSLICTLSGAYADSSDFVIQKIRVDGLQRIEMGTVFSYLPVKVGDTLTANKTDDIIQCIGINELALLVRNFNY